MAIERINISSWSREQWEEDRRKRRTIGGSDAAAVLGLSKYASPYSLWAQKTGLVIPEDISDKEAVRLGVDLEEYVARRWMEATGKRLKRDNHIILNTDFPFAHANVDRLVIGEPDAGFEAKTTSSWEILQQCQNGQYPDSWYCQMCHYMMVTGAKRWYLGVLVFGRGFFHFTVERNEEEIEALECAEAAFYQNVENNIPPAIDGSDASLAAVRKVFDKSKDGFQVDLTPIENEVLRYRRTAEQIKALECVLAVSTARIQEFMGNAESGSFSGGRISWKTQQRTTFDRKKFEEENGAIDPRYFKTNTIRPFKVAAKEN